MIPLAKPLITGTEKERVLAVLESGQLAAGPQVRAFEEAFAAYIGTRHAVMMSSGTAALLASVVALGIQPGDKVFVTPFTFIATANALLYARALPVFVDIDLNTYNLCPEALAEAAREHPDARAAMVVHLYGLPADMERIGAVAAERGLTVIEDCCQSPGAALGGRRAGTFGQAAVFSFYATKNLTTGEGGALVTDDPEVAARARDFIDHGQRSRYHHEQLGYNFRMGEIQAALGLAQLERLEERNEARRANASFYGRRITRRGLVKPVEPPGYRHVYHHYTVRTAEREAFMAHLARQGVGCGVHYPLTVPDQPLYRRVAALGGPCPAAATAARQVVSIPVHPGLSPADLETVAAAVNSFPG